MTTTRDQVPESASTLHSYFGALLAAHRAAEQRSGENRRCYVIAGHRVHLRFAGPALAAHVAPTFAHLEAPCTANSELTICLFDSVSTSTPLPHAPWPLDQYLHHQEPAGDDGSMVAVFVPDSATLSVVDLSRNLAVVWRHDAGDFPPFATASPLMFVLHAWMRKHGYQLIHAAAVGKRGGGVLFTGKSGVGKSTTAFRCLVSGLDYLSDDYCLLGLEPQPHVCSVYSAGRLCRHTLDSFPMLDAEWGRDIGRGKVQFLLHDLFPDKLIERFPVRAILIPVIGSGGDTSVQPVGAMVALRALAPSTIVQLAGAGPDAMAHLSRLVRQTPSYVLRLGSNPTQIARTVLQLLAVPSPGLGG